MHKPTTLGKHRSEMHLNRAASWLKARLDGAPLGSQSGPSSVDDGVSTTKSLLHPCLTLCCHAAELKLLIPFSSLMVNDNSSSCRADCVAKPETTKQNLFQSFQKTFLLIVTGTHAITKYQSVNRRMSWNSNRHS